MITANMLTHYLSQAYEETLNLDNDNIKQLKSFKNLILAFKNNNPKAIENLKQILERKFDKNTPYTMMFIPISKKTDDKNYIPRFENLFEQLQNTNNKITRVEPIKIKESRKNSGTSKQKLNSEELIENYEWVSDSNLNNEEELFVIDDIITTGASFRSISDFLRKNNFKGSIKGIFFGRVPKLF